MLRIVFRTLMRRAYNSGDWENARKYALKIIDNPERRKIGEKRHIAVLLESERFAKIRNLSREMGRY